ncbi:MAG: type II toxin-antitoxin system RelE/ParE family toxin [Holophaga sp.]|nr:type II toxin-antitoxin system RelE/ParE family toxin [Holophaga sp.]
MLYQVLLTEGAERDLETIHGYLLAAESRAQADQMLDQLQVVAASLARFPARGTLPKELKALGIMDFRQVFCKPYRVIYRVLEQRVIISLIADGRRELQTLLESRLLHG